MLMIGVRVAYRSDSGRVPKTWNSIALVNWLKKPYERSRENCARANPVKMYKKEERKKMENQVPRRISLECQEHVGKNFKEPRGLVKINRIELIHVSFFVSSVFANAFFLFCFVILFL